MSLQLSGDGSVSGLTSINTDVSSTEVGYLDGVTSALQTQINSGGLVKIVDQSFTSASAVSVNGCFTSAHENYKIVIDSTSSDNQTMKLRWRVNGTDNLDAQYEQADFVQRGNNTNGQIWGGTSNTQIELATTMSTVTAFFMIDANKPALAVKTRALIKVSTAQSGSSDIALFNTAHRHDVATAYDGFSFFPSSGTVTGTLRVYGYRN
jgi:hypothetical protein